MTKESKWYKAFKAHQRAKNPGIRAVWYNVMKALEKDFNFV